ncbi:unnamed protein product [Trichogramma brassicae]|uniref:Uncharacterized protein n=1 Tax=Trichogramma brassicae TaxID=86971 RepID=A0A6H5J6B0_9HYME|nr:unnamed protein product [Trichogramma brassicae]
MYIKKRYFDLVSLRIVVKFSGGTPEGKGRKADRASELFPFYHHLFAARKKKSRRYAAPPAAAPSVTARIATAMAASPRCRAPRTRAVDLRLTRRTHHTNNITTTTTTTMHELLFTYQGGKRGNGKKTRNARCKSPTQHSLSHALYFRRSMRSRVRHACAIYPLSRNIPITHLIYPCYIRFSRSSLPRPPAPKKSERTRRMKANDQRAPHELPHAQRRPLERAEACLWAHLHAGTRTLTQDRDAAPFAHSYILGAAAHPDASGPARRGPSPAALGGGHDGEHLGAGRPDHLEGWVPASRRCRTEAGMGASPPAPTRTRVVSTALRLPGTQQLDWASACRRSS